MLKYAFILLRWKKCKSKLSGLTNTDGHHRPGQAGTTGQLFFTKCGDPPEGCECKYEEPTGKLVDIYFQCFHPAECKMVCPNYLICIKVLCVLYSSSDRLI